MDAFSRLLAHSSAHASLFFSGRLCGESHSEDYPSGGQLHLLRAGELMLQREGEPPLLLQEPTLIFYPVPCHHRLIPRTLGGCDLVCASLHFGEEGASALRSALPDQLLLPLRELPALAPLLQLLFDEAFGEAQGREAILGRLVDLLLVYLLRHIQGAGLYRGGILAGLADIRLAPAIAAMHEEPERPWTLASLASLCHLSRARFAVRFHEVVGMPALAYLTRWRLNRAQCLLLEGMPIKLVAPSVGYGGSGALAKAFEREEGVTPARWLAARRRGE